MDNNAIVVRDEAFLAPAAGVETMLRAYQAKKEFIERVLAKEVDYGPIPGSDKPALKKPGAEKMANLYGLAPTFDDVETIEDWSGSDHAGEPFFYYRQKCKLWKGDRLVASADGSCNSWEKKYRYRQSERVCPNCGQATIFKSKNKPEFYCWQKKGGCGATFPLTDKRITEQEVGQIRNPDVAEQVNTILKMAQKRALVAAVLIATCASDYFTQDIEDFINADFHEEPQPTPKEVIPSSTVQPAAQPHDYNWAKQIIVRGKKGERFMSELENSALEWVLDHGSPEQHEAAGIVMEYNRLHPVGQPEMGI